MPPRATGDEMHARLPLCLALSAAAHLLLLVVAPSEARPERYGPPLQALLAAPGSAAPAAADPLPAVDDVPQAQPATDLAVESTAALPPLAETAPGATQPAPAASPGQAVPAYFAPTELDRRASVSAAPDLPLPTEEVPPGHVRLRLFLNERGSVDRVEVEESTLPAGFTDQLRGEYARLKFTPAQRQGLPVPSWLRFEVVYEAHPAP